MDKLNKKIATKTVKKQGCKKSHSKAIKTSPSLIGPNEKSAVHTEFCEIVFQA